MPKLHIQHLNEDRKRPNPLGHKGLAVFYTFLSDKVGIIALAAPTGLVLIGLLIPSNNAFLALVRIVCFLNVLHVFPFCTDGQVILLSLLNIVKKGGKA